MRELHDVFCRVFREKVRQICLFVKPYTEYSAGNCQDCIFNPAQFGVSLSLFSQVLDMLAVACSLSVIRVGSGPKM